MEKQEIQHFVKGLKSVIKRSWSTQEEFAQGVTSTVNLSNILNGNSGTSLNMRQALAARAGHTIDELISFGRGAQLSAEAAHPVSDVQKHMQVPFNNEELSGMSAEELLSNTGDFTTGAAEYLMAYNKSLTATVKLLVDERNRMLKSLQREQLIINSIDEAIKVVDTSMKIVYCNRSYTELYQQFEGDGCDGEGCNHCKGDCLVKSVLASGRAEYSMHTIGDTHFTRTGYPVTSTSGKIDRVIVVSRQLENFIDLITEQLCETA